MTRITCKAPFRHHIEHFVAGIDYSVPEAFALYFKGMEWAEDSAKTDGAVIELTADDLGGIGNIPEKFRGDSKADFIQPHDVHTKITG